MVNRRHFLESVLRAARVRNVRLGIRTHLYQAHPMAEAARRIREAGFQTVHIGLRFADGRFDMSQPDWDCARRTRETFGQAGLPIAGIDGYVPLLHPDPETRQRHVHARCAPRAGPRVLDAGGGYRDRHLPRAAHPGESGGRLEAVGGHLARAAPGGPRGHREGDGAGTGRLDYRAFVTLLGRLKREVALCIEHAKENEVAETVKDVRQFLKED